MICTAFQEDGDEARSEAPATVQEITQLPRELLDEMVRRRPAFKLCHSHTADQEYYANACSCGTFFGDHFIYSDPGGGGFFPTSDDEAAQIDVEQLPIDEPVEVEANWGMGAADHILEKGNRI